MLEEKLSCGNVLVIYEGRGFRCSFNVVGEVYVNGNKLTLGNEDGIIEIDDALNECVEEGEDEMVFALPNGDSVTLMPMY